MPARTIVLFVAFLALAPATRGDGVFSEVALQSGIDFRLVNGARGDKHLYETMIGGAGWLDYDGDGWLDLYLVQGHESSAAAFSEGATGNVLFRNRGDGTFEDVTERAGVGDRHYGCGVATGDIDNDGDTDLYVTNVGPNVLYLNRGDGSFEDITERAGVDCPRWSTSAAFADIDGDGLLDLYVANYLDYDPAIHGACTGNPRRVPGYCHPNKFRGAPDRLYLNIGGGRFRDISKSAGVAIAGKILGKGLGVLPTDFDGDGRVDFVVANDSVPNFVWRNRGDLTFEDAGLETGMALSSEGRAEACMGIDGGDVNGDGLIDYMMTNFSEEKDTLYLAEGDGFFLDASARSGLGPLTFRPLGFGLGFLDHDLDGDLDVFIARGHILDNITEVSPGTTLSYRQPDQLLENDGSGRFTDVSSGAGAWFREAHVGRAAAFADYDNDGDVDVVVVNTEWRAVLLRNDRPRTARWLGLGLRGNGPSNRDATGSLIRVKLRGRDAVAPLEARTAWSYQAACDPRRIVGLGRDGDVEHVTVRWPDGLVEVFRDVNPEAYNELVRGTGQ